jgi:hypothetical protein
LSRFPLRFRCRHSLLGHPLPAREFGSPRGRPTGPPQNGTSRTQTGFPRSARTSSDRGGCPLYPGDDGARPDWPRSPARVCRFSTARPCTPPQPPSNARLRMTRHQRGFKQFTRPVFPSPVVPGWNGSPWALPRASHPTLAGDARRSGDRPSSTDPKQRSMSSTSLQTSVVYSKRATSCRTHEGGSTIRASAVCPVAACRASGRPSGVFPPLKRGEGTALPVPSP